MGFSPKKIAAAALMAASLALGGCVYDDYGYGGVNVGYGTAGGYGYDGYGYGNGYYGSPAYGYGGGFGSGWYNDFYYPGTGYYVFDRSGRRSRWNGAQQRYWQQRQAYRGDRRDDRRDFRGDRRDDRRDFRRERREDRSALRGGTVTPEQFRQDRRDDRQDFRQERRQDRQQFRRDNPGAGRNPGGNRPNLGGGRREGGIVGGVRNRVEQER